jgi:hypothetical protein
MTFYSRPLRALPTFVVLLVLVGAASGQSPDRVPSAAKAGVPSSEPIGTPQVRILDRSARGFTVEVTATWQSSLAASVSDQAWATIEAAVNGLPVATEAVDLPNMMSPVVTVVATEFDEVALPFASADAEAFDLVGPVATISAIGIERRRARGTVVVRLLQADESVLRRYRRVVARVDFGQAEEPTDVVARQALATNPHLAVTRSVLADGRWFKVSVSREGVYRIDRAFLQRVGLNPDQVDPDRVQVYGNGGAPVPRLNRAARIADLAENATLAIGGGDGKFDAADGVYFYASAPSGWTWSQADSSAGRPGWSHFINPYSAFNYYFVRVDAPSAQRVQTVPALVGDAMVFDRVEGRVFVNDDRPEGMVDRDGGGSGLDWLGRDLTRARSRITVLDTIPDGLAAGQVRYRGRVAARSTSAVNMAFLRDGQTLGSTTITNSQTEWTLFRPSTILFSDQASDGQRLRLDLQMTAATGTPTGWIDYVEAFYQQELRASQDYLRFVTPGGHTGTFEFVLSGFSAPPQVWDITRPDTVRGFVVATSGDRHRVRIHVENPEVPVEVVAFVPTSARARALSGALATPVANQNLHGAAAHPDYVIVTAAPFLAAAEELAAYRAEQGLTPLVVDVQQVYNEFSGGLVDPSGVRDFLRFLYDRAPGGRPVLENVLLLGNGHYDYRGIRPGGEENNWVPTFQTDNSSSYSESYTSDDFFGLLEPDEGLWPWTQNRDRLDIGIGRLPVNTAQEAAEMVRKIRRYEDPATQGAWRGRYTLLSDDHLPNSWDTDLHVQNSEVIGAEVVATTPSVNLQKIYMAMYPLQQTALGARYPAATAETLRGLEEGTLVWNYSGHGGPNALADERLVTREDLRGLTNFDRLTIAITATCSFGRYDLFEQRTGGEEFVLNPNGGAVAIFTTTRVVFAGTTPDHNNLGVNVALNRELFRLDEEGRPRRLGDAYRAAKARMIGSAGLDQNGRKFNLLGDPAMRIGLPERSVGVAEVNGIAIGGPSAPAGEGEEPGEAPVLRGQELATIGGNVLRLDGTEDVSFSGEVEVTVYDVERTFTLPAGVTRRHTDGTFRQRPDVIYRGRASVQNGRWSVEFIVPRDVSYAGRSARISAYASSSTGVDGLGFSEAAVVGTTAGPPITDNEGPRIRLFLNDTTFVSGGLVGSSPVLIARLSDESGINMAGAGVGHEMLLVINGRESEAINVGSFYRSDLDTYRSGSLRYVLPEMPQGPHTVSLTAWDVVNNASTATLDFVVEDSDRLRIAHSYPYPNPTTGPTRFVFEHNQLPHTPARVQIRIYTINGRPVRTLDGFETLPEGMLPGSPVQILWDGRDEDLDLLATGVYLYRVRVEMDMPDGERRVAEEIQRLAIIR